MGKEIRDKILRDIFVMLIILVAIISVFLLGSIPIRKDLNQTYSLLTNNGFIFLCTFLGISVVVFAKSNEIRTKLTKPSKYLFPIFIALSFSFGIVSLIFGIHSDIFTAYDQNENGEFAFKWFKPAEILNFPISQLKLTDTPEKTDIRLNESRIKTEKTCHLIFVDKTLSLRPNDSSVNNFIYNKITKHFSADNIQDISNTADLLPIYILSELNKINTDGIDANDSYGVFYYDGIEKKCKNFFNSTSYVFKTSDLSTPTSNLVNEYVNKNFEINTECRVNNTKQETRINDLLQYINDILLVNQIRKPAFDNVCIYILSDFIDDSQQTINLQAHSRNIRSAHTIKAIKLYHLKGKSNNNSRQNSSYIVVKQLEDEFKEFNPYKAIDLNSTGDIQDLLKELKVGNYEYIFNNKDKLKFYYPYNEYGSNKVCKASIKLPDSLAENYYNFQLKDIDNPELRYPFIYQVNNETKLIGQMNAIYTIRLRPHDELKISLQNYSQINNDRIGVDISSDDLSLEQFRFIELLPKMPKTTCYYLIIFYSIFVTSVGMLLFYPTLFLYLLRVHNPDYTDKKIKRRAWIIPMAWGLFPICFLFYTFSISSTTLLTMYSCILLVMLTLSIPAFRNYYLEEKNAYQANAERTNANIAAMNSAAIIKN